MSVMGGEDPTLQCAESPQLGHHRGQNEHQHHRSRGPDDKRPGTPRIHRRGEITLVTRANSGLGFEAAAQFADAGYGRVFTTARTDAKAENARQNLGHKTSRPSLVQSFTGLRATVGQN
jgi:hypothetical protein